LVDDVRVDADDRCMISKKWTPLAAISLGTFMLLVDVTIVNVALPDMVEDLHATFSGLQWVIDAYALTLAALLLGVGSLGDLVGRRRTYLAGLGLFAASSLACGVAPSSGALIAARGVQGIGAAAMFATTMTLLNATYGGRDRGVAFGVWGAVSGAAAAAGPLAGGLLTEALSWRWIFFVNLPISIVAVVLTLAAISESRPSHGSRPDVPGAAAFSLAAGAATAALVRVSDAGWAAGSSLALYAVAIVALAGFVAVERRSSHPMLDLKLLRHAPFSGVLIAALLLSVAAFGTLAYASLWLQSVLGLSPIQGGLVLLPLPIASFTVSLLAGRFLHGADVTRWAIGGGLLAIGAGGVIQLGLDHGSDWTALLLGLAVTGVGVGLATPTLASAAMAAVAPRNMGMAAGAVNTARQLGLALGIAVLGTVYQDHLHSGAAAALGTTFGVAGVTGLLAGALTIVLLRRPAGEVAVSSRSGHLRATGETGRP
jgi:EmrB/QacA subfamily drug resistance transporter